MRAGVESTYTGKGPVAVSKNSGSRNENFRNRQGIYQTKQNYKQRNV
jgi:hypothetical protein